jgi:chromosome segregation ATPase
MEQNLDITERLTLKRPYYTLTSDDLSEAAAEIIELRRTVLRLEAQYGVQAKKAEDLEKKIAAIKEGYEGCCTACEPVALRNQELLKEVKDLTERHVHMSNIALGSRADVHQTRHDLDKANKERDEARRLACFLRAEIESTEPLIYCRKVAEEYKWDCFKDDSALGYHEEEANANNNLFRSTDMS